MIYYITTEQHRYTIEGLLGSRAAPLIAPITPLTYEILLGPGLAVGTGAYVFADLERLSPAQLEGAAGLWRQLELWGAPTRLLNHPTRVRQRYEMLRELHEQGINSFNVYRLTEARRPKRFPVFIRREHDHRGTESELLYSQAEVDAAIERLDAAGKSRDGRMLVEFCAAPDRYGYYRKYGTFRIGETLLPRSINFSSNWVVKHTTVPLEEPLRAEEYEFVRNNLYEDVLRRVFEIARIDFGRADFGVVNGRVEIYEINTNPVLFNETLDARLALYSDLPGRTDSMLAALARLDPTLDGGQAPHAAAAEETAPRA